MTGVPAPAGWEARTPLPNYLIEWRLEGAAGAWLAVRVHRPYSTGKRGHEQVHPARAEWRTGVVSSFGPDFTDPTAQKEFGWAVLQATQAVAAVLAAANGPAVTSSADEVEPDDGHMTIFDFEELARG